MSALAKRRAQKDQLKGQSLAKSKQKIDKVGDPITN
jgi:hypothetical protein